MGHPAKQKTVLRPHHSRPFRARHIMALGLSGILVAGACLELGSVIGAQRAASGQVAAATTVQSSAGWARSSRGFSFRYDPNVFAVTGQRATADGRLTVVQRESDLASGLDLASVSIRPVHGAVSPTMGATRLDVGLQEQQVMTDGKYADVATVRTAADMLGGRYAQRTLYRITPTSTNVPSYAVHWQLQTATGAQLFVTLRGLLSPIVPGEYQLLLDGLNTGGAAEVKAARTGADVPLLADAVSPSVVRVYHAVCGHLRVNDTAIAGDKLCDGVTGSGFFVSKNGYIATNGHVVISGAKDIFANLLASSPELLTRYLRDNGLSVEEALTIAQRPELLASMIAKIYDTSDDQITLEDSQEAIFVALGNEPLKANPAASPDAVFDLKGTEYVVRAKVAAYDYSPKDMFTIAVNGDDGFSSSDVALLKTELQNTPALPLFRGEVMQDQDIIVVGFPADAENDLVSPNTIAPTVTRGTIGAVRWAAGGASGKLYQSDADASRGSSGGPAINAQGQVIGLLTYRFASGERSDAAKSYIRDIYDVIKLAKDNDIALLADSQVQTAWQTGLGLYAQQHYQDALRQFAVVKDQYVAHRLVGMYIDSATVAVREGRSIPRHAALVYTVSLLVFVAAFVTLLVMVIRHYAHHRLWRHTNVGHTALHAAG